jgi:hypothetical protein
MTPTNGTPVNDIDIPALPINDNDITTQATVHGDQDTFGHPPQAPFEVRFNHRSNEIRHSRPWAENSVRPTKPVCPVASTSVYRVMRVSTA